MRGPVRYLREPRNWNDLSQNYTASKLWLQGKSPSDPRNFSVLWKREADSRLDLDRHTTHLAPPLGELVVLAPIAAFPWKVAKILWLTVLLGSFAVTVWALALAGGFRWRAMIIFARWLSSRLVSRWLRSKPELPVETPTILVIGFCAVAIWAAHRHRDVAAGILVRSRVRQ